jgi:hypothetical protein
MRKDGGSRGEQREEKAAAEQKWHGKDMEVRIRRVESYGLKVFESSTLSRDAASSVGSFTIRIRVVAARSSKATIVLDKESLQPKRLDAVAGWRGRHREVRQSRRWPGKAKR